MIELTVKGAANLAKALDAANAREKYALRVALRREGFRLKELLTREIRQGAPGVVDHLLAAPEPKQPPAVKLVEVKGEVPSTRPWVRYEYADPALESLSSGQKIMVRVGTTNAQRLKSWLSAFRQAIVSPR